MSLNDAAESVWESSEVIGFAYITTVDTPERVQQFVDLVTALKGTEQRYDYAPLRIGRVGRRGRGSTGFPVGQTNSFSPPWCRLSTAMSNLPAKGC